MRSTRTDGTPLEIRLGRVWFAYGQLAPARSRADVLFEVLTRYEG